MSESTEKIIETLNQQRLATRQKKLGTMENELDDLMKRLDAMTTRLEELVEACAAVLIGAVR